MSDAERLLSLPKWCTLTDEEVVTAIALLSQRKKEGDAGFVVTESDLPEWYTLKVPVNCAIRQEDIITALNVANRAAGERHATATLKFQDGKLVHKKIELPPANLDRDRIRIEGPRMPDRF